MSDPAREFFNTMRGLLGPMTQEQVDNINLIVEVSKKHKLPLDHAAYVLATAVHESRVRPVYETFASDPEQAARRLERIYGYKRRKYWRKDETGQRPLGRGFVQLTWRDNYVKMAKAIGVPELADNYELALDPKIAAEILVVGMKDGLFTGRKMSDYNRFYDMRRVVNGLDQARRISNYAKKIRKTLAGIYVGYNERPTIKQPKIVLMIDGKIVYSNSPSDKKVSFIKPEVVEVREMTIDKRQDRPEHEMPMPPIGETIKSALQSKTIWGGILIILSAITPPILHQLGQHELAEAIKNHDYMTLAQIAFGALVLYGRQKARSVIRWPRIRL